MILLVYAHPHHSASVTHRALLDAVDDLPGVRVHALYDRYPDFSIDGDAERELLVAADLVVWQHPVYWYSPPALLKLWFETVLARGFAYGEGGDRLAGKECLWVASTGAPEEGYTPTGAHGHRFESFVPAVRQTAQFCGMRWLDPIVVHGARRVDRAQLARHADAYRARLSGWLAAHAGART
jgi:glutathione-regulated potassium-efflux system ancillary protein KefF